MIITKINNAHRYKNNSNCSKKSGVNPLVIEGNSFSQDIKYNLSYPKNIYFGMATSLIGRHFENIGTVIAQPVLLNTRTQQNTTCNLICSLTQNGGTIHLIKEDNSSLKRVQELFKANPEILGAIKARFGCVTAPAVEKILETNKELATIIKQSTIAEISYMKLSSEDDLKKVAKLGYEKIDNDKDVIFLQNLIVKQTEYKNAMKTVVIPLLKGLTENGLKNILIRASAFGDNPKSPIHLYESYGFKPLGITEEEVEKHKIQTAKGSRLDPNYRIMMYLPQNASLYSLLNRTPILEVIKLNLIG